MNPYSLPSIISFTVNFSLALIVLVDNPKSALNRWFSALIMIFALWNISEVVILNSSSFSTARVAAQILYRIIFLSPAFFVIVAYHFPKNFHKHLTRPLFYVLTFSLPVILLSMSFPEFQIEVIPLNKANDVFYYQLKYSFSPSFIALLVTALIYMLWGDILLIKKIPRLRTVRQKSQTRFFAIGMMIIFFVYIILNLLRAIWGQAISYYFVSTVFTLIIAAFFFTSIIQFKFFNPSRYLTGGITYSILSSIVLAVYFLVIKGINESIVTWFKIDSYVIDGLLIFVLVVLIRPFEHRLHNQLDRLIHSNIHQNRQNFLKLYRELQSYLEPEDFFSRIKKYLTRHFNVEKVLVFNYDPQSLSYVEIEEGDKVPAIPADCPLILTLKAKKQAVEFYDLDHRKILSRFHDFWEKIQTRVILPLIYNDELLAIIVLTRKKYGLDFTQDELEILSIFANEIAGALKRNRIIEDLRLKDRQNYQLEKLATLGRLTAGIAHEIRNPLNTISTASETLLKKDIPEEDQEELKRFIMEETARLNRILNDFLNLSRIRPAQIISFETKEFTERLILSLQSSDRHGIQISYEIAPKAKVMRSDPDLLMQALLNLGLNAMAAIRERCEKDPDFKCHQGHVRFEISADTNHYRIIVWDNGIGISDEIKESVFDPFFTTKETGTGLGLSIVHQIVDTLMGKITLQSRYGATEFTIMLPRKI